jgi:DtxR family transcriptional regulator, Mn-dependent transcriptional regulator
MLPSSTVENYLKTIALQQDATPEALLPTGQLAQTLGVTPGTATTMVKALADAGLVKYEPYSGVRLTEAGRKLAALVLRRHRLIELFLVQVLGLRWDEVHEEAEKLEHVVSDRLIERIDEMLGRPGFDPHGDPIPEADGTIRPRELHSLVECPLNTPVAIRQVADQQAEFLRFAERTDLTPGQAIEVEARDAASDSVRVRGSNGREMTIGMRAASKLLVEVLPVILCAVLAVTTSALAQDSVPSVSTQVAPAVAAPTDRNRPFEIVDNSFLVEEAFNQEPGIFQNIFGVLRTRTHEWAATFTQEWPVTSVRHQLSYALVIDADGGSAHFGDIAVNYRYQLRGAESGMAITPRVSLLLRPDGDAGLDFGAAGLQFNLPASKQVGDFFFHGNAGLTLYPSVESSVFPGPVALQASKSVALLDPFVAASVIFRTRPMFNLMLEGVLESAEAIVARGETDRTQSFTLSPGARFGWNIGAQQLVFGVALPITREDSETTTSAFAYASWELPFVRRTPTDPPAAARMISTSRGISSGVSTNSSPPVNISGEHFAKPKP